MNGHVVCETAECYVKLPSDKASADTCEDLAYWNNGLHCDGCMGNGSHVVVGSASPVNSYFGVWVPAELGEPPSPALNEEEGS